MIRILAAVSAATTILALTGCDLAAQDPVAVQPAPSATGSATGKPVPIKLVARRATAKASIINDGTVLSCVRVTVTNQGKKQLDINPLYFSLTDTAGTKHDVGQALGFYDDEITTTTLAPGENAKGMVCGKGKWKPKVLAMTNPLFDEAARAEVGGP